MNKRPHACLECGGECGKGEFCGSACRMAFNNRRKARGAELYDLFMVHRFATAPKRNSCACSRR